jgi:hypothetical protein
VKLTRQECITAIELCVALAIPVSMGAQQHHTKHLTVQGSKENLFAGDTP